MITERPKADMTRENRSVNLAVSWLAPAGLTAQMLVTIK